MVKNHDQVVATASNTEPWPYDKAVVAMDDPPA